MAQKIYVDALGGRSANGGTSWADAKATIADGLALVSSTDSEVYIAAGDYYEGNITVPAYDKLCIVGVGRVIVNSTGYDHCFRGASAGVITILYKNLVFTGFGQAAVRVTPVNYDTVWYVFHNCLFYQKASLKDQTYLGAVTNNYRPQFKFLNCTSWGVKVQYLTTALAASTIDLHAINSIFITTAVSLVNQVFYNNASNQSSLRGTNGWDTATYPIPVYSEDSTNPDLRIDPNHAQYEKYSTGGLTGEIVGHTASPTVSWDYNIQTATRWYPSGLGVDDIWGVWINDVLYYDETFREVVVTSANNRMDFIDNGTTYDATVADGTYSDESSLMTAVSNAMNAVASSTITVVDSDQQYTTISTDGTQLELLTQSGTNQANSIWNDLGFNTGPDKIGQTTYVAEQPLCIGPGAGAPLDAAPVVIGGHKIALNLSKEPYGQSGRTISPVVYMKAPIKLKRVYIAKLVDGLGEIDNSALDADRTIEVRAQNTPFLATDAAGTTTLDWTQLQYAGLEDLDETYSYWQFRAVIRRDKVS